MRKEQSRMLEKVTFHLLPILTIIANLPATHANRNDFFESRYLSDVLEDDKHQPGALWDRRRGDHEFDVFVGEPFSKLEFHSCSIGRFAGYRSAYRSPNDTVLARGPASASAGYIMGMQAVESITTSNEVHVRLACAEGTTGSDVEIAYADVAVDDEYGQGYCVQDSSVVVRVVVSQTQPRSMPATANEGFAVR